MTTAPSNPTETYVAFAGEINEENVAATVSHFDHLVEQGITRVVLAMQTLGGSINSGMHLYEKLREMPFDLVTHGVGVVASMGIPIYLAGEERLAGPQCEFLLHRPTFTALPGKEFDIPLLRERIAMLEADEQRTRAIYEDRTPLTSAEIDALKDAGTTMGAHEAVGHGIAHSVKPFAIPPGHSLIMIGQP
jgi:ATP-dependent Clp protease, protease subunit